MLIYIAISLCFCLLVMAFIVESVPFMPLPRRALRGVSDAAGAQEGMLIADLGSGDGRILIECARRGARAHGYEINPLLVLWSRCVLWRAGLGDRAQVHWRSFWDVDLSGYDAIVVFGITKIMQDLERKLQRELRPGARVVSYGFAFPSWPVATSDGDRIQVYNKT